MWGWGSWSSWEIWGGPRKNVTKRWVLHRKREGRLDYITQSPAGLSGLLHAAALNPDRRLVS